MLLYTRRLYLACLPACVKGGGYYGVTKVLYGLPKPHKDSPQARTPVIVCVCIFLSFFFFSPVRARESLQPLYVQWRWRGHRVTRAGSHPNDRNLNAHPKRWLVRVVFSSFPLHTRFSPALVFLAPSSSSFSLFFSVPLNHLRAHLYLQSIRGNVRKQVISISRKWGTLVPSCLWRKKRHFSYLSWLSFVI